MKVHCLFEQSGTFKNEFIKLGYEAFDYDILNDFGETDYQIDLFKEIQGGYEGKPSVFDEFNKNDLILAFFPCIRFENQIMLHFRGQAKQEQGWSLEQKMQYDMDLLDEVNMMYKHVNHLFMLCIQRNLKLVMENPYSEEHFLRRYWCYLPAIIDKDRRENGDYFKKPTQYWFLNCEPKHNLVFEPIDYVESKRIQDLWGCKKEDKVMRSKIHPQYANRFIRQYLIDQE